ncbi:MAG: CoA transferase [Pyrobaculum arsenaticum]|uniref:CoA transferase n=2 Tax=Pyrobaculum TaxID=2276 RepID=UPI000ADB47C3|nr:CoA transferase [Pyrobaculum arsenaticum]MCY0890730.1 CoA transferase [Pyrobaculum arsenaticum]
MAVVLEIAQLYPGPLAGRLLREWGFRVVKVEPPGGDPLRRLSPTLYQWLNEGKEVVYLDLRLAEDRGRVLDLAKAARAVLTSFRRGTAERLGISYEAVKEVNSDVFYVALVGYREGDLPGHDINFAGLAGLIADKPTIPQCVDVASGLMAAFAVAAAVASGRRGYVEIPMENVAYMLNLLNFAALRDLGALPLDGRYPFYNVYKCASGLVALGAVEEKFWRRFCDVIGREDLKERMYDPTAVDEVRREVERRGCGELISAAERLEVPLSPVRDIVEASGRLPPLGELFGGRTQAGQRIKAHSPYEIVSRSDKELVEALNRQLNYELRNAYLYLSMAAYFDGLSLGGFAHFFKVQANEELKHALRFYNHLVERGWKVELYDIPKPKSGWGSVLEAVEDFYNAEVENTKRIWELVDLAKAKGDKATESFLKWFVDEQVEEEKLAAELLAKVKLAKDSPAALLTLDNLLAQRKE